MKGKTFEWHGVWYPNPSGPPKFRNILRVSPARRGFNGARSPRTNWNFYVWESAESRTPPLPPPPPCIRDRYASAASKWVAHLFQFHFITVFESRGSLAKRTATRNSHETSDGTRRIICLVSVLSRNLAYFVLKQIALNPRNGIRRGVVITSNSS